MELVLEDHLFLASLSLLALEFYCLVRLLVIIYHILDCVLATINTWLHTN